MNKVFSSLQLNFLLLLDDKSISSEGKNKNSSQPKGKFLAKK